MIYKNTYIKEGSINSAGYRKFTTHDNKVQHVVELSVNGMITQVDVKDLHEAQELIAMLDNPIRDVSSTQEKTKTYIDGFKDGCEYTLKLKKEQ